MTDESDTGIRRLLRWNRLSLMMVLLAALSVASWALTDISLRTLHISYLVGMAAFILSELSPMRIED